MALALRRALAALGVAGALFSTHVPSWAAPLVPTSDAQIVEVLPATRGARAKERNLQKRLAANALDAEAAAALAHLHLQQARQLGDARFAGRALGALAAWPDPARAPAEILLMLATVQQYLHEFDAAADNLERLVQREPLHAQAWLTLATVRRVQGRYAASSAACEAVRRAGQALYAQACKLENQGLLGALDATREGFLQLLATAQIGADTRAWLLVSLAELETRSGNPALAEAHYRSALAAAVDDDYARLGLVDLLLDSGRAAEALALTDSMVRSDSVLVRRAAAAKRAGVASARTDAAELRGRIDQAEQRRRLEPTTAGQTRTHAREQAMFALWVEERPAQALSLARANVALQREPIDLVVLALAAKAAGDSNALRDALRLQREMGLYDVRLSADR